MTGKPSRATQQKRQKALNDAFEYARQAREITELKKQFAEKDARIAELETALRPFASAVNDGDVSKFIQVGDLSCNLMIPDAQEIPGGVRRGTRISYLTYRNEENHLDNLRIRHLVDAAKALKGKSE